MDAEQQAVFLDLTRRGWNRGAAAKEAGTTGTRIRRMTNEDNASYDADFAAAYHQALAEISPDGTAPEPRDTVPAPPSTTTRLGFTKADYLTDDDLEQFLELVTQGIPRKLAARQISTSLLQIERRARIDSDFGERLSDAYKSGYPMYQEWIRGEWFKRIEEGNYTALRDAIAVHLPEGAALRTTRHEVGGIGGGNIKVLVEQVIPGLPPAVLDAMINHLENKQAAELPDIEQRSLPTAAA